MPLKKNVFDQMEHLRYRLAWVRQKYQFDNEMLRSNIDYMFKSDMDYMFTKDIVNQLQNRIPESKYKRFDDVFELKTLYHGGLWSSCTTIRTSTMCHTLLELAAGSGCKEVAEALLAKGAKHRYSLYFAIANNDKEITQLLLLDKGTNVDATHLSYALERDYKEIVQLLLDREMDVNTRDFAKTPLFYAAERGHEGVVKLLLDRGANVDARDNDRKTPLFYAAERGHEGVVKLLLDRGANVNARTRNLYNRRPRFDFTIADHIMGSIEDSYYADVRTPLHYARNKQIKKLLQDNGASLTHLCMPVAKKTGIISGCVTAFIMMALVCNDFLPTTLPVLLSVLGVIVASTLIVGSIAYGITYMVSKHSLNSELSEVNVIGNTAEQQPT